MHIIQPPVTDFLKKKAWRLMIARISALSLYQFMLIQKENFALRKFLELEAGKWSFISHFIVQKKWDFNYEILGIDNLKELFEPFGEYFFRELELCIECYKQLHNLEKYSELKKNYLHPAVLFSKIIVEDIRRPELKNFIKRSAEKRNPKQNQKNNKLIMGEASRAKELGSNVGSTA